MNEEQTKQHMAFLKQQGVFCWSELITTDVPAAIEFYTKLFGWTTEKAPMEGMEYTMVKAAGTEVGGIMTVPPQAEGMPPMWGVYVTVNDVDATAKLVEKLGGKILMPPTDIPNVGRFCVIQDPQGALISAITFADA